jgi:predicted ATPase/DNA-binding winged helix-turn-helix (wHTH) protein
LDLNSEQLWRDSQAIALRPKTFAVLRYLVEHGGQLVTKDELLDAVWAGTVVGDAVLKSCIGELRQALGDDVQKSQYIATVHRRGYRFIGPLSTLPPVQSPGGVVQSQNLPSPSRLQSLVPTLVGRESELTHLHSLYTKALAGERQIVFITGEPGIGKTALINVFRQRLETRDWRLASSPQSTNLQPSSSSEVMGRGQCVEQYGAGEAYLPVLDALSQLAQGPEADHLQQVFQEVAPLWLLQLPLLARGVDIATLHTTTQGATQDRMLREFTDAVELLTQHQPLVLVLEDLHWSDHATVELLAFLARRYTPARFMLIGTYRPVELLSTTHPLRSAVQELRTHQLSTELALSVLHEKDVAAYLTHRFPLSLFPTRLAQVLHQRTEGNPLFLVSVIQDMIAHDQLVEEDGNWLLHSEVETIEQSVPESIRQLVARQRERLQPDEQQLLEAGSIAGLEFAAATVAAAIERPLIAVEVQCQQLSKQQQFLQPAGMNEWPDGTVSARYRFQHALYQQLWHEQVPVAQQQDWHCKIGERLELAYNGRAQEIAVELAVHFEQGHAYQRAVQYRELAGRNALQKTALQEAITHFTDGLELLQHLPDSPHRQQQAFALNVALGPPLMLAKGYRTPEALAAYATARELLRDGENTFQAFQVMGGYWLMAIARPQLPTVRELAEHLLRMSQSVQNRLLTTCAHLALGMTGFYQGELILAQNQWKEALTIYDPHDHNALHSLFGQDPGVLCLCYLARDLWLLGYPDAALQKGVEAIELAQHVGDWYCLACATMDLAWIHKMRGDLQRTEEQAARCIQVCQQYGFPLWRAQGVALSGWAMAERGQYQNGITQIQEGLEAWKLLADVEVPGLLTLLAEACARTEDVDGGLGAIAEGQKVMEKTGERFYEAEVYRLKGELMLQQFQVSRFNKPKDKREKQFPAQGSRSQNLHSQSATVDLQAEACFRKAIDIARCQNAKSWELRATMSLVRLWQQQDKKKEARQLLSEIYQWFTEGFGTKDLQEAKALLEELA